MHGLQAYAVVAAFCIYAQCGEDVAKRGGWRPCIKKSWKNHGIVFLNLCGNPVNVITRCVIKVLHCI